MMLCKYHSEPRREKHRQVASNDKTLYDKKNKLAPLRERAGIGSPLRYCYWALVEHASKSPQLRSIVSRLRRFV